MKGRIYKTGLVLTAILTCLLMISTATAVPVTNSEPVMELVEEHEELLELKESLEVIMNSDLSTEEKKDNILQLINDFIEINIYQLYFILLMISYYLFIIKFPTPGIIINFIIAFVCTCGTYLSDNYNRPLPETLEERVERIIEQLPNFLLFLIIGPWIIIPFLALSIGDILRDLLRDFPTEKRQPI